MTTVHCPECDRLLRPCNLERHLIAQHTPTIQVWPNGWTRFGPPRVPIRVGLDTDRRYDEVFPRGEGDYRYRIYRLRAGELELLAGAPDPGGFGVGLATMHSEGEYGIDDAAGVLDTREDPGDWIVNPWALGRRAPEHASTAGTRMRPYKGRVRG